MVVMRNLMVESYMRRVARRLGIKITKVAFGGSILDNPQNVTMIEGALKAVQFMALIPPMDWKLATIAKLLESWVEDKKEEREQKQRELQYGTGGPHQGPQDPFSNVYY